MGQDSKQRPIISWWGGGTRVPLGTIPIRNSGKIRGRVQQGVPKRNWPEAHYVKNLAEKFFYSDSLLAAAAGKFFYSDSFCPRLVFLSDSLGPCHPPAQPRSFFILTPFWFFSGTPFPGTFALIGLFWPISVFCPYQNSSWP